MFIVEDDDSSGKISKMLSYNNGNTEGYEIYIA